MVGTPALAFVIALSTSVGAAPETRSNVSDAAADARRSSSSWSRGLVEARAPSSRSAMRMDVKKVSSLSTLGMSLTSG